MNTLTDTINNFVENDDLQSIEAAFNSGCHPIKEPRIDLWTGKFLGYETIWVDTKEVNKEYYEYLLSIGKHDSQIYELDNTGKIIGFKKSYCS